MIKNDEIDLIINTPSGKTPRKDEVSKFEAPLSSAVFRFSPQSVGLKQASGQCVRSKPRYDRKVPAGVPSLVPLQMRAKEGSNLHNELLRRIGSIGRAPSKIRKPQPRVAKRYRALLFERPRKIGLGITLDDDRLTKRRQDVGAPCDGCKRRNPQTTPRQFHRPGNGMLACGYEGIARLWPFDVIVAKALEYKKR
jgi:hypothetical protein